jgi:hypothetical protein
LSGKTNYSSRSEEAANVSEQTYLPQRQAMPYKRSYDTAQCEVLWESVCIAIDERYRRSDLTAKLVKAHLEMFPNQDRAIVRLARPWLANSLLLADRALLQMAFSQEIGPGYSIEIVTD